MARIVAVTKANDEFYMQKVRLNVKLSLSVRVSPDGTMQYAFKPTIEIKSCIIRYQKISSGVEIRYLNSLFITLLGELGWCSVACNGCNKYRQNRYTY